MPGFYSSTQYRYLDKVKQQELAKKEAKQLWIDGIRQRAHDRKHVDIGTSNAPTGKMTGVPKDYVAGNPRAKEETVGDLFAVWAPNTGLSDPPKYDKNQKQMNKYAVKVRATTAKGQGSMRRTEIGENIRYTASDLWKKNDDIYPKYKPKGDEVYGKPVPKNQIGDLLTNFYGNEAKKEYDEKT